MIRNILITALTVLLICVSAFAAALYSGTITRATTLTPDQIQAASSVANWDGN